MDRLQIPAPRRTPEPGRPFINREYELSLIRDKLEQGVQGKPMPSGVVCFWGTYGLGKSWLLLELQRLYRRPSPALPGPRPTVTARLDLNQTILPALWQDNQLNRERLIRELWKQLAEQIGGTAIPDVESTSAEEWADKFVQEVTGWAVTSATPIILLDTVDDLVREDKETFFWLEQHLVERLAMTDQVLFVFTSRAELRRWDRLQVRRRIDSHRLAAFEPGTAGQAVGASPEVSELLFGYAYGHPLVTEILATILEKQGVNLQAPAEVEQFLGPALARQLLRAVVAEMLRSVPEPLTNIARYISIMRWVSVESLRFLGERLELVEPGRGDAYYLDELIGRLQTHHLLYWNSDKNRYEPDPVLGRLLARLLELDQPGRFCAAHQAAFTFHQQHLQTSPQYLARYLPELAYHGAVLGRCQAASPQPLSAWWSDFLAARPPASIEPWSKLLAALAEDHELQSILPVDDYDCLYQAAEQRAAGTPA